MFPHFGFHVLFKFSHFTFSLVNNVNMITGSWCACGMFAFEEYYGTALKATYSVFEATFSGSWPLLARNLIRDVSEWCLSCTFFYFAMLYFLAFSCNVILKFQEFQHLCNTFTVFVRCTRYCIFWIAYQVVTWLRQVLTVIKSQRDLVAVTYLTYLTYLVDLVDLVAYFALLFGFARSLASL